MSIFMSDLFNPSFSRDLEACASCAHVQRHLGSSNICRALSQEFPMVEDLMRMKIGGVSRLLSFRPRTAWTDMADLAKNPDPTSTTIQFIRVSQKQSQLLSYAAFLKGLLPRHQSSYSPAWHFLFQVGGKHTMVYIQRSAPAPHPKKYISLGRIPLEKVGIHRQCPPRPVSSAPRPPKSSAGITAQPSPGRPRGCP